ncbi:hypothetical protein N7534_005646 [Penicillium rubens]|nr:hypothetical protein N7534_005646 [Penicillium rubens]
MAVYSVVSDDPLPSDAPLLRISPTWVMATQNSPGLLRLGRAMNSPAAYRRRTLSKETGQTCHPRLQLIAFIPAGPRPVLSSNSHGKP